MATRPMRLTPFGMVLVCVGFSLGALFGSLVPLRHLADVDKALAGIRAAVERPVPSQASSLYLLERLHDEDLRIQRLEKLVRQLR